MKIYYHPRLKQFSRHLRNNSTLSEIKYWKAVKGRKIYGYQFLRQKPIGHYIVDFYCSKLKLVVEIDGSSHIGKEEYDLKRQNYLENLGLTVMRFDNRDVRDNLNDVIRQIEEYIQSFEEGKAD